MSFYVRPGDVVLVSHYILYVVCYIIVYWVLCLCMHVRLRAALSFESCVYLFNLSSLARYPSVILVSLLYF